MAFYVLSPFKPYLLLAYTDYFYTEETAAAPVAVFCDVTACGAYLCSLAKSSLKTGYAVLRLSIDVAA